MANNASLFNITASNSSVYNKTASIYSDDDITMENISSVTNVSKAITYLGGDIKKSDAEMVIIDIGFGISTVVAVVIMAYFSKLPQVQTHLYNALAFEHLGAEFCHLLSLVIYNWKVELWYIKDILKDVYSTFDTVIPFSTFCLAGIVYLKLFLFPNGEELYSNKEIAVFSTSALSLIELYQYLFTTANFVYSHDEEEQIRFDAALKLTTIFLIMAIPIAILGLILFTLMRPNSSVPKLKAGFFSVHLSIFILSDIVLVLSNFKVQTAVKTIWTIFLVVRIIVEGIWFMMCNGIFAKFLQD